VFRRGTLFIIVYSNLSFFDNDYLPRLSHNTPRLVFVQHTPTVRGYHRTLLATGGAQIRIPIYLSSTTTTSPALATIRCVSCLCSTHPRIASLPLIAPHHHPDIVLFRSSNGRQIKPRNSRIQHNKQSYNWIAYFYF